MAELKGKDDDTDGSWPIFAMYLKRAKEEDEDMAKRWKDEADKVFLFTALFAAVVASLITVSIQIIQPSPQNISNFYLANIQNAFTNSNSNLTFPSSPPPFSPPTYGIWVNALWFLSLIINLTCAILASLLQQWARRYLEVTQTRSTYSLHKQARTRTFFAEGVKRFRVPWVFEALPALLHLSVFLFFAGLVVYLWHINLATFKLATAWVALITALYACVTVISLFEHDSPYRTPLTPLARSAVPIILYIVAVLHVAFCYFATYFSCYSGSIDTWTVLYPFELLIKIRDKILMTPEEASLKVSSKIDTQAFMWTFDGLDEDKDLDHFFTSLPGFFNSKVVNDPQRNLDNHKKRKLLDAIIRLLDRTYSSSLLSEREKTHKVDIYIDAMNHVVAPDEFQKILLSLAPKDGSGPVQSANVLDFVRRWGTHIGAYDTPVIKAIFHIVLVSAPQRDRDWLELASEIEELRDDIFEYHRNRDSLSLAILIYITRLHFTHIREQSWPSQAISDMLRDASKFNAEDTSPELQNKFCALWNEIVDAATQSQTDQGQDSRQKDIRQLILRPIHEVFVKFHPIEDTRGADDARKSDAPRRADDSRRAYAPRRGLSVHLGVAGDTSQFPLCRNPAHRLEPRPTVPVVSTPPPLSVPASLHTTKSHPPDQLNPLSDPNHGGPPLTATDPAPSAPFRGPTPVPDSGTAAEGDDGTPKPGTPKPDIPKGPNVSIHCSASANPSMTMPDSRPPSPPPVADLKGAIAGYSPQELNTGNTGDRPPHPSHGSYDIV